MITQSLAREKYATIKQLTKKVNEERKIEVSRETVRRSLHQSDYEYQSPIDVPFLTQEAKEDRVEWARDHLKDNWTKTLFTDEASFWLDNCHVKRWLPSDQSNVNPKRKYPPKLHVWAGVSSKGIVGPIIFHENMNGELFSDILLYGMSQIKNIFKFTTCWRVLQDGDSKHRCTLAKYIYIKNDIEVLFLPSSSPDLNVIENVWAWVKREVEKLEPKTLADLEECIEKIFKKITISFINSLVSSMYKRLKDCIESNGEKTDY